MGKCNRCGVKLTMSTERIVKIYTEALNDSAFTEYVLENKEMDPEDYQEENAGMVANDRLVEFIEKSMPGIKKLVNKRKARAAGIAEAKKQWDDEDDGD